MPTVFRNLLRIVAASVLLLGLAQSASASTISYEVTFGAANFTRLYTSSSPVGLALGQFTLTFDPAVNSTGAATVDFLNVANVPSTYQYSTSGLLYIYGNINGFIGQEGTDDFRLLITSFNTSPHFVDFIYTTTQPNVYQATVGEVHVSAIAPLVATTSIPAALPLFASALGGLVFVGWRRRKPAAA